jgi:hypothetical protein
METDGGSVLVSNASSVRIASRFSRADNRGPRRGVLLSKFISQGIHLSREASRRRSRQSAFCFETLGSFSNLLG